MESSQPYITGSITFVVFTVKSTISNGLQPSHLIQRVAHHGVLFKRNVLVNGGVATVFFDIVYTPRREGIRIQVLKKHINHAKNVGRKHQCISVSLQMLKIR